MMLEVHPAKRRKRGEERKGAEVAHEGVYPSVFLGNAGVRGLVERGEEDEDKEGVEGDGEEEGNLMSH